jgi:RimJ/RimL family protein N-acetyltransferase
MSPTRPSSPPPRAGFRVEGRIRRAQWRAGRWHDELLLSVLRDEWAGPD